MALDWHTLTSRLILLATHRRRLVHQNLYAIGPVCIAKTGGLTVAEQTKRPEHVRDLNVNISEDKRSRSVGQGIQELPDNQIDMQSLLQKRHSTSSTNIFLPNVAHVKHNVSEKMAQVNKRV